MNELHFRRAKHGLKLEDYISQNQLKALIYLIYLHGDLNPNTKQINSDLLEKLRSVRKSIPTFKPTGLLKDLWQNLSLSWAELLALFWGLLNQENIQETLKDQIPLLQSYLRINRSLYLFFCLAIYGKLRGKKFASPFLVKKGELEKVIRPNYLANSAELKLQIPLLVLETGDAILSPELLYDDLLKNYLETLTCSDERKQTLQVQEHHLNYGFSLQELEQAVKDKLGRNQKNNKGNFI